MLTMSALINYNCIRITFVFFLKRWQIGFLAKITQNIINILIYWFLYLDLQKSLQNPY